MIPRSTHPPESLAVLTHFQFLIHGDHRMMNLRTVGFARGRGSNHKRHVCATNVVPEALALSQILEQAFGFDQVVEVKTLAMHGDIFVLGGSDFDKIARTCSMVSACSMVVPYLSMAASLLNFWIAKNKIAPTTAA
jgi:hypothetical protein